MSVVQSDHRRSAGAEVDASVVARGLSKSFTQGVQSVRVLDGIDLELLPGELVAILGPSGSGKSTLLNILGLLTEQDDGDYLLDGTDTLALSRAQRSELRLQQIAFVFQAFHLIEHKDVAGNVELPLKHLGVPRAERARRVDEVLERLGLDHRRHARIATLSGGEKQRVAIARALVAQPRLMLCDEPTGSLDSQRSRDVISMLRAVTGPEQTTVIVTHDSWVAAQCDRSLHVQDGRLVDALSDPDEAAADLPRDDQPGAEEDAASPHSGPTDDWFWEQRRPEPTAAVPPSGKRQRIPWSRLALVEAWDAVTHRFRRNLFTMLGVALGVASLVLTVGLTATISAQLTDAFDVFQAKRVVLTPTADTPITADEAAGMAQGEPLRRLQDLNGVESAALIRPLGGGAETVTPAPESRADFPGRVQAPILTASPDIFAAQGQKIVAGRGFDDGHISRRDVVAVAGEGLLDSLGLEWSPGMTLWIGSTPVTVIGVASENASLADYYAGLYLPIGVELDGQLPGGPTQAVAATAAGAAEQVGAEAPVALDPAEPNAYAAALPPEPETLRAAVDSQQRVLMLSLSAVTLLIGAVGIMNTFLVAVIERRREVGLRLALGAGPRGIMMQFAAESLLTSILGTVMGVIAAINIIAVASLLNHWTPVIGLETILAGLVAGVVVGVLAGLYPAWKASRIDPVESLMQG